MKRKFPVMESFAGSIARQMENIDYSPVSIEMGVYQESVPYYAAVEGRPIAGYDIFNTFRYQATDEFTKKYTGDDFFSKMSEKFKVDRKTKSLRKELEWRVDALRGILKRYGKSTGGLRISLVLGTGSYEETEKSCCYTSEVSAGCEVLRGTQMRLPLR